MSTFNGVTFAFSHSDNVWRTRYSFTPTCYGCVDNKMISANGGYSSPPSIFVSNGFWEHDTNETRNNFYDLQSETTVAFVSNDNPSSTKIFKSLSIEGNSKDWTAVVATNMNPNGADPSEEQLTTIDSFIRKEGNSYAQIPPSQINSTANVSFVCTPVGSIYENLPEADAEELGILPDDVLGESIPWFVDIAVKSGAIPTGLNVFVVVAGPQGPSYIQGDELVPVNAVQPSYDDGFAVISSYDPVNQVVNFKMRMIAGFVSNYPFPWMTDPSIIQNSTIMAESPAMRDGDYMRGSYANFYLRNQSTEPMECLLFNVNYEPTKLDHSLGRNA